MKKRMTAIFSLLSFLAGIAAGAWLTTAAEARAQAGPSRFQVQNEGGFMFIRNTRVGECFIAVNGGGIVPARCD